MDSVLTPYLAMVAHTLLSAGTYLITSLALKELAPGEMAFLRFVLAAALFALLLRATGRSLVPPAGVRGRALFLGLVGLPLNQGLFLTGLSLSTPTHAAILYALTPACVLLGGRLFLGEALTPRKITGVLVAFAGVLAVILGGPTTISATPYAGDALLLLGVLAWAVFTVGARPLVRSHGAIATSGWTQLSGTLLCLPLGPFLLRPLPAFAEVTAVGWTGLAWLVLGTSLLAYLLWTFALKRLEAGRVAVFTNLQPVATALFAWLLFGDRLTLLEFLGGLLVIGGVVWSQDRIRSIAPVEPS